MAQPPRVGVLGHSMERPSVGQDGLGCVKACDRVHDRVCFGATGVAVRVRDAPRIGDFQTISIFCVGLDGQTALLCAV